MWENAEIQGYKVFIQVLFWNVQAKKYCLDPKIQILTYVKFRSLKKRCKRAKLGLFHIIAWGAFIAWFTPVLIAILPAINITEQLGNAYSHREWIRAILKGRFHIVAAELKRKSLKRAMKVYKADINWRALLVLRGRLGLVVLWAASQQNH